ncbi:hypothetical protein [Paenibacillus sp. GCM10028914]|uniref:hypothetical protein n=1 Tax=Paenibacillus sp. GCM10028914 TaxID=3273416 RepID=UPI00361DD7FE
MSEVYLNDIQMKRESKSFIDSLHAVLTAAGLFEGPKYMLSGLTGMAFKFTVHKQLLPMSVTAYGQWGIEHQAALDNLGIYTVSDGGFTRHPTSQSYRHEATQWVKESLDQGKGVIYWLPEFGVVHGYDDEDAVFFIQDGISSEDQIVLYDNFGLNITPFWDIQLMGDKVDVPMKDMILESMRLALEDWNTPYKTLPSTDVASGRLAFDYLAAGLERGIYDETGAVYIMDSYIYSRKEIKNYLREAAEFWTDLQQVYELYSQLVHVMIEKQAYFTETPSGRRVDREQFPLILEHLHLAKGLEEQAMNCFKAISARHPDPKRSVIPRWGAHIVR